MGQGWVSVKARKISEITRGDSGLPESLGEGSTCWGDQWGWAGGLFCVWKVHRRHLLNIQVGLYVDTQMGKSTM